MPDRPWRIAIVVAGAGARGGYEAGALSVLIPRLHEMGVDVSMYIGTSAGAINATLFAGFAHLPPAEQAQRALDIWRGIKISDVFESPVRTSPGVALRFLGQTLHVPGMRLTSLLDTEPLRRTADKAVGWQQLRANIDGQALTLAVVTTSGDHSRSVVFVDRPRGAPLPPSDDDRPIDYVPTQIGPQHVLASSAIPIAFPPVRIDDPADAKGWYLDGGVRLNAPLKPAISLGADALVAVATHPLEEPVRPPQPSPPPPDVDDMVVQLIDTVLVDRMVEDARTLCKINTLIGPNDAVTRRGRRFEKKPLLFVGPPTRATLGEKAMEVFDNQRPYGGDAVEMLRRYELRILGHALAGDGPRRGDLFSYLYFDRDFIEASIALGQQHAEDHFTRARLEGVPSDEVPWTTQ
jgi:NTE family protein